MRLSCFWGILTIGRKDIFEWRAGLDGAGFYG